MRWFLIIAALIFAVGIGEARRIGRHNLEIAKHTQPEPLRCPDAMLEICDVYQAWLEKRQAEGQ